MVGAVTLRLGARIADQRLDMVQQEAGLPLHGLDIAEKARRQVGREILDHHLGITEDRVDRSAQVVAEPGFDIGPAGRRLARDQVGDQAIEAARGGKHALEIGERAVGTFLADLVDDQLLKAQ